MLLFAIVALFSSSLFPIIVSFSKGSVPNRAYQLLNFPARVTQTSVCYEEGIETQTTFTGVYVLSTLNSMMKSCLTTRWVTIPRAWIVSHLMTSIILLSTCLANSTSQFTIIVCLLGIPWALTQWAPLALTSVLIETRSQTDTTEQSILQHKPNRSPTSYLKTATSIQGDTASMDDLEIGDDTFQMTGDLQAGAVMGVYNIAIASPQIVAALGSSLIFAIYKFCGLDDDQVVGWVIRIWGVAGLIAAWLATGVQIDSDAIRH